MKVLHLNGSDEIGRRFNGLDIHDSLLGFGVESTLGCFWNHTSKEPWVFEPFPGKTLRKVATAVKLAESLSGHQSRFQFWSSQLFKHPNFIDADLVHLQVVHDYWFKLESVDELSRLKPTLWTWHDLWPLTGHCLSPVTCPRWQHGCGHCPDLRAPLRVARDRTDAEFERKHKLIRALNVDVTVATDWARRQIGPHLDGTNVRVHVLPFGIDTELFAPTRDRSILRGLGIAESSFVVMARSTPDPQKGFLALVTALDQLSAKHDITLLTVQQQGLAERHSKRLKVVDLPWMSDPQQLARVMAASDVFAMPSTGESFGMMALEAMACGVPVVHASETATAEVVSCPKLAVDSTELSASLSATFEWILSNPSEVQGLGKAARQRAETVYGMQQYLVSLVKLYEQVIEQHKAS